MQHISGTLTADATIQELSDGRQFISFSIADRDSYKPKGSEERVSLTTFFNCTYWLGTGVAKVLRKGAAVDLIGRAWAKPYQDRNDNWTAALNFNAREIRLTAFAPKADDSTGGETTGTAKNTGRRNSNTAKGSNNNKAGSNAEEKDDLPF